MNCAIDVSVLEACEPAAPIDAPELTLISEWLDDFEKDPNKCVALDQSFRLWKDYERFDHQNRASLLLLNKLDTHLTVPVTAPAGSVPVVGGAWAHLDNHRTWLLAVCLVQAAGISIINATFIDWHHTRLPNTHPLPTVVDLLPAWLAERARGIAPVQLEGAYVPPPKALSGTLAATMAKGCGKNGRKAWEDANYRYEWDYQHGRVEVYRLSTGTWIHEASPDGTVITVTGGENRVWGR